MSAPRKGGLIAMCLVYSGISCLELLHFGSTNSVSCDTVLFSVNKRNS